MVLPCLPIFAEETTTAAPATDVPPADAETTTGDTATGEPSTGETTTGDGSAETPGTTPKPEEDYKLPPFDEQTESIPDKFEFDEDMLYIAYKNTTTYSLVRSKNAMVVVKAKLLELQETFFKLTAEDPTLAWNIHNNKIENLTAEQR